MFLSTLYHDDICIHLSKNHSPPKYMSAVNRKVFQAEEDLLSNILEGLADYWQQLAEQGRILEEDAR